MEVSIKYTLFTKIKYTNGDQLNDLLNYTHDNNIKEKVF
jgi:hypothetical protein